MRNGKGAPGQTTLLAADGQRSVLAARSAGQRDDTAYSPYGHRQSPSSVGRLGFNGELPESATGHYLLGSGYRGYNPLLMRFNQPDSWSPFGAGGLNAYAYCVGDPVNRRDPTGHMSWGGGLGLAAFGLSLLTWGAAAPLAALGTAVGAAGTAADVVESGPGGPSPALWVSIAVGVLSLGVGGGIVIARKREWLDDFLPLDLSLPKRSRVSDPQPLDLSMRRSPAPVPLPRSPTPPRQASPDAISLPAGAVRGDGDWFKNMIQNRNSAEILKFAGEYGQKAPTLQALRKHLPLSEDRLDGWKLQLLGLGDVRNVRIRAQEMGDARLETFINELEPLVYQARPRR